MPASIILIGLPGAGKTTIGCELAKKLDFAFLDTDTLIEHLEGYSISEIFEAKGEENFRKIEASVISSLNGVKNKVISIGGGAFQQRDNRENLQSIGKIVYLYSTPEIIYQRIKNKQGRPLLACENLLVKLEELYAQRHETYMLADYKIDTSNLNQYNVVEELLRIING